MDGDLSYCTDRLTALGSELLALVDVMAGTSPAVRHDPDDLGHRAVHDALAHFDRSWDDRRELLTRSVEAVGGMALDSAAVLSEADAALARQVVVVLRDAS